MKRKTRTLVRMSLFNAESHPKHNPELRVQWKSSFVCLSLSAGSFNVFLVLMKLVGVMLVYVFALNRLFGLILCVLTVNCTECNVITHNLVQFMLDRCNQVMS